MDGFKRSFYERLLPIKTPAIQSNASREEITLQEETPFKSHSKNYWMFSGCWYWYRQPFTLRNLSITDRGLLLSSPLWGSRLSSNNGQLNTEFSTSPCCGCDPRVRETMRPSRLKLLSFIGLSAAAREAMYLWGVILLCRLCQRPRIFFRLTASLKARLYTQPHGEICCNSLKIETYLKYILERKIAVNMFNQLYFYTLSPPIDFECAGN